MKCMSMCFVCDQIVYSLVQQGHKRTAAKAVKPDDASQRASMKSRVAPKVLCRRRGEEGGDITSGSGDTAAGRPTDISGLCLPNAADPLHCNGTCSDW